MATSNSINYTQTRNEIIADALVLLAVYRPGATVSTADYNICSNYLNKMVKAWVSKGLHVWAKTEGTLYLRNGVNKYSISVSSSDQAGNDAIATALTAAAASTTLIVTSTAGMTAADNIGIELDNNTRQWTTIVSVDSTTQLTITTGLTSAASSGNTVFTYTTHAGKALDISSIRSVNSDNTEVPVWLRGEDEFMSIPVKSETSDVVSQAYYRPGLTDGTLYVWPTPQDVGTRLSYSYQRTIEDFDAAGDNPDFPAEWLETLTLNLAARVYPIYGKKPSDVQGILADANRSLMEMEFFDVTRGSLRIIPNLYPDNNNGE